GQRLLRAAAMAGWKQLHPKVSNQPVGDVAGGDVQSSPDRSRIDLGRSDGHEHYARLSARLALAAGCGRFPEAHRPIFGDRVAASHSADVCAFRFLLGPFASSWPPASADSGGSQLRLGAESWRRGVGGCEAISTVK